MKRWALGIEYNGQGFHGWQSQPDGNTIQDVLTKAIAQIAGVSIKIVCAGRTDTGVHATYQVVHFDTTVERPQTAWVRGVNRFLPNVIRVLWAHEVDEAFHARFSAFKRSYRYVLYSSPVRPALYSGMVGWIHDDIKEHKIEEAIKYLVGEHDFSAFRSAECQAKSPIKTMHKIHLKKKGPFWLFDFEANAFLHHMIRNLMGAMIAIGRGQQPPEWIDYLLNCKNRGEAAPTFSPDGLYLTNIAYPDHWKLPRPTDFPFN